MIKIEKYNESKTYMYPNGDLATPEKVKKDFPAVTAFTHIVETDEAGQVLFAIQNLAAIKSQMGIDANLSDEESIRRIEELRNAPAPEPEPDSLERVAAALEYQKSYVNVAVSSKVGDLIMGSGYIVQRGGGKDYSAFKARVDGSLTEVTAEMLDGITSVVKNAFSGSTSLRSVIIPSSVASIGDYAFSSCYLLTNITISNGVTSIGNNTFAGCTALTSINIPSSVTSIGPSAFYRCSSLTSIDIPSSVRSIENAVFDNCTALTSVTIPSSVRSIGNAVFNSCTALTSVTIPSSVRSIGSNAFYQCTSLTSVTVEATTPPTLGSYAFYGTHTDLVIYVPAGSVDTYKAANNWSTYASKIQAIPST